MLIKSILNNKKGKTLKFLDAGGYNRNEIEGWNGSTERGEKRKTLDTERSENI